MQEYRIQGGKRLSGTVQISGSKNAVLPEIAAALLADEPVTLRNVPDVSDAANLLQAVQKLGAKVTRNQSTVVIDPSTLAIHRLEADDFANMRASYYLLGALLGRCREGAVPVPGGCCLGGRPINLHLQGFESLGCKVEIRQGVIVADAKESGLHAAAIWLELASVGATINIMLAAVTAPGVTRIQNAAKEPHVCDVCQMLCQMGAKIQGIGTSELVIEGVSELHGCRHWVIGDQIEAATFMAAAAATGGEIVLKGVYADDMSAVIFKFREAGCQFECRNDSITMKAPEHLHSVSLTTAPYPGYPTDAQPQLCAALLSSDPGSVSVVEETVFSGRFAFAPELIKMGASMRQAGRILTVTGAEKLEGAVVYAKDLRAGAALIVAGLSARGETVVRNVHFIHRGYENLARKLQGLGADIRLVVTPDKEVL